MFAEFCTLRPVKATLAVDRDMNIFTLIRSKFSYDLYIQVWENRIKASYIQTKEVYDQAPLMAIKTTKKGEKVVADIGNSCKSLDSNKYQIINPFSHPRMLLNDFQVGQKLIQHVVKVLYGSRFFTHSPRVIFQPMEKTEGGLTAIEERAFREICIGAGAREVLIHVGNEYSLYNVDFDKLKQAGLANSGSRTS